MAYAAAGRQHRRARHRRAHRHRGRPTAPRRAARHHRLRRRQAAVRPATGRLVRPAGRHRDRRDVGGRHARRVAGRGALRAGPASVDRHASPEALPNRARPPGARLRPRQRRRRRCAPQPSSATCSMRSRATTTTRWNCPRPSPSWDGDRLTVWDKVQGIPGRQRLYRRRVRRARRRSCGSISPVRGRRVSAARKVWPHQLLASFAAREMGRPVKLVLTRKQFYGVVGYRPTSRQRLAIGADRSGTHRLHHPRDLASRTRATRSTRRTSRPSRGSCTSLPTCARRIARCPSTSTRRPTCAGRAPPPAPSRWNARWTTWHIRLGMDPIELRLRNEPDRDQDEACRSPLAA